MFEIAKRLKRAVDACGFFARHEYYFDVNNVINLLDEVAASDDGIEFPCDVRQLEWESYAEDYVRGIRKYILKDDSSTLENARRRLKM